jgi:23S rRNA (adenine2503-C2)-methyltransferase
MFNNIKTIQSSDENVMKFVFEKDDAVAEAVLYKYPTYTQRTVICCSTQSGCPVGCRFCGAGNYFVRSLTAEEIVHQVDHCLESQGIDATTIEKFQIMVMSMGEPLLNFKALEKAFDILYAKYPQAKLLISSIGPKVNYEPIMDMCERIPNVGLQFSVHESTDEKRNALIPFKKKLALKEISEVGEVFLARTGRKPFFNYCAHEHNSSQEDADRIADLLSPAVFEATISVVCEVDESIAAANARQRELANSFMKRLMGHGFSTRMFDPAGQDDIGGGCGQLWFVQDWMKNNPEKAKKSVGFGMERVHAPRVVSKDPYDMSEDA